MHACITHSIVVQVEGHLAQPLISLNNVKLVVKAKYFRKPFGYMDAYSSNVDGYICLLLLFIARNNNSNILYDCMEML